MSAPFPAAARPTPAGRGQGSDVCNPSARPSANGALPPPRGGRARGSGDGGTRRLALLLALSLVGCAHGELRVARLSGVAPSAPSERVRVIRREQDRPRGQEIAFIELTGDDDDLELTEMVATLRETGRELGASVVAMVRVDRVAGAVRVIAVAIRR